jgi:hypothetical protein
VSRRCLLSPNLDVGPDMTEEAGKRLTVRIPSSLTELLDRRCQLTGLTLSEAVRGAVEVALGPGVSPCNGTPPPAFSASDYAFPRQLDELLPRYRAFGMEIWKELRRCFGALVAICEVVRQHSQNAQDRALCAELVRLGKLFGLLP